MAVRETEENNDSQVFGSCDGMYCIWRMLGTKEKIGPQLTSLLQRWALRLQASLTDGLLVPKRIPEDLFLVEVGKVAPGLLSVSRLDKKQVPWTLYVGELASGPISWRRPSYYWRLRAGAGVLGLRGLRQWQLGWVPIASPRQQWARPPSRLCCIQWETFYNM